MVGVIIRARHSEMYKIDVSSVDVSLATRDHCKSTLTTGIPLPIHDFLSFDIDCGEVHEDAGLAS